MVQSVARILVAVKYEGDETSALAALAAVQETAFNGTWTLQSWSATELVLRVDNPEFGIADYACNVGWWLIISPVGISDHISEVEYLRQYRPIGGTE